MQNLESFYKNYELWDSGDGRRLERFGDYLLDRPAPQANYSKKLDPFIWGRADFIFDDKEWKNLQDLPIKEVYQWSINISGVTMSLHLSDKGQVGLFPEQFDNWSWIDETISSYLLSNGRGLYSEDKKFKVLNAFSYTGGASIFSAKASSNYPSEICHLDASKAAVSWASDNAKLNKISNIRWIVDDTLSFIERELRRERFYDAVILDPPAFGRAGNKTWSFKKDLMSLLEMVKKLVSPAGPLFFIISSHDSSISKRELRDILSETLSVPSRYVESSDMMLYSKKGNSLHCGIFARFKKT